MKTEKKTFDAVRTMREIRDAFSSEIAGMTYEEERRFIEEHLKDDKKSAPASSQKQG